MSSMGICSALTRRGYAAILRSPAATGSVAMQGDILGAAMGSVTSCA